MGDLLCGGLVRNRQYLVEDDPGTGKTTLAFQFLLEGAPLGEKGLHVTLSESRAETLATAASHGWNLGDPIEVFERSPHEHLLDAQQQQSLLYSSDLELGEITRGILAAIGRVGLVLAPIVDAVRLIGHEPGLPDRVGSALSMIDRQVQRMKRLVDDLLEVSRIEQDKIALRREPMLLCSAVDRPVETLRPMSESARQVLTVSRPSTPLPPLADPVRLTEEVENLLVDAVKFTPSGGAIRVEVDGGEDRVECRVRDTGVGIDPDEISRFLTLFSQLDATLDRSEGGLGIGLALVRRLV